MNTTSIAPGASVSVLSQGPSAEELTATAGSLLEMVKERRAIVAAFEGRTREIATATARTSCKAIARVASEIADELPGVAIARPKEGGQLPRRFPFTKRTYEKIYLKVVLVVNARFIYTAYKGRQWCGDVILLDKQGRLYQSEQILRVTGAEFERLQLNGNLPIKDLDTLARTIHETDEYDLGKMASQLSHELEDDVEPATWNTISSYLDSAVRETAEQLRNEAHALDSKSKTYGLPR